MAIEIPMDGIEEGKVGGFDKLPESFFHFEVVSVDEDGGHNGGMVVELEVLRGLIPGYEGMVHRETFFKDLSKESARKKFWAFAVAAGLATNEEMKKSPAIEYTLAVGRQVVAELSEFNGFMNFAFTDHVWHPADRRAYRCPLNAAKIAAAKIVLPPNRHIDGIILANAAKTTGKPQSAPAATSKAAASIEQLEF